MADDQQLNTYPYSQVLILQPQKLALGYLSCDGAKFTGISCFMKITSVEEFTRDSGILY